MRQDADVILVGEMRDLETISLALHAAEMGALVFGTLHTTGAAKTIDRMIDVFPGGEQPRIRLSLGDALAAVVSQLLLPTADGKGRVAATEILFRCQGLPNAIREGATPMIRNLIQSGQQGRHALDGRLAARAARAAADHVRRGAAQGDREAALREPPPRLIPVSSGDSEGKVAVQLQRRRDRRDSNTIEERIEMPERGKKKPAAKKSSAKKPTAK